MRRPRLPAAVATTALLAYPGVQFAQSPTIQFQGQLDLHAAASGPGPILVTFKLFDAASGGTSLWEETHEVDAGSSRIQVLLGTVDPGSPPLDASQFAGPDRWLAVEVEGRAAALPRFRLATVPFAFVAQLADGLTPGALTGPMIADQSITIDKLASQCAEADVLMREASGWACKPSPIPLHAVGARPLKHHSNSSSRDDP